MKNISLTINQNIATVTLNRPELHNAFDDVLIRELTTTLERVDKDSNVRVVMLTANGKNFCAGADLNWMQKTANYSLSENLQDAHALAQLMLRLHNLSKPTLAVVHGAAYGGGVGLITACDIAIASTNSTFCFSEVKLGIIPAVISPYVIAAIGERAARRYFLTAEKFNAEEAQRIGLIHKIVTEDELMKTSENIVETLLQNSPAALRASKKLINDVANHSLDNKLIQKTVEAIADIRASAEGQEGLKAFLEKRSPNWINSLLHKK